MKRRKRAATGWDAADARKRAKARALREAGSTYTSGDAVVHTGDAQVDAREQVPVADAVGRAGTPPPATPHAGEGRHISSSASLVARLGAFLTASTSESL